MYSPLILSIFITSVALCSGQWLRPFSPSIYDSELRQLREQISHPFSLAPPVRLINPIDEEDDEEETDDYVRNAQRELLPLHARPRLHALSAILPAQRCGSKTFEPHKQFCYRNRPYNRFLFGICGPRLFKKQTHFCLNGQTYNRLQKSICGKEVFDKLTQMCIKGQINNICGGEVFDPHSHFCYERIYSRSSYSLCGKRVYRKRTHYCFKGRVLPKISTIPVRRMPYTPKELALWGRSFHPAFLHGRNLRKFPVLEEILRQKLYWNKNTVRGQRKNVVPSTNFDACGNVRYNTKSHFCFNNKVNKRCGIVAYNPEALLCFQNHLYTKDIYGLCGGNMYNKYSQLCTRGHVIQHDPRRFPQLETLLTDYNNEVKQKEQQDIFNLSKQLAAKRRTYRLEHGNTLCGLGIRFKKRSHFCYNGKLYNRSLTGICGYEVYNKQVQRCLAGGQLFPAIDVNKSPYYVGPNLSYV